MTKINRDNEKDKIILDAYLEELRENGDHREAVKKRAVGDLKMKLKLAENEANEYFEEVLESGFPLKEQKNIGVIDRSKEK